MMEPQGSQYNQAVLSPVAIDVYLIQILVGRGDESVMIERVLGVWAASERRFDSVYLNVRSECHTILCLNHFIYLYKVVVFSIALLYTLKYDGKRNVFYFITFKKSLMKTTWSWNIWTIITDTTEIKNKYNILVWSCIFLCSNNESLCNT